MALLCRERVSISLSLYLITKRLKSRQDRRLTGLLGAAFPWLCELKMRHLGSNASPGHWRWIHLGAVRNRAGEARRSGAGCPKEAKG